MLSPNDTLDLQKTAGSEPIPGYRLVEPLGSGGFGEVWKCEAPGGLFKAIKFIHNDSHPLLSNTPSGAEQELRALQHVKSIRHPFLLSMDRVEHVGNDLVIVMELADRSLHDLLVEYQKQGLPGIPRDELLLYMLEVAEVLDLMNQEYGLEHLDIKPRNLFLVGRHIKVADFGLVNSLAERNGQSKAPFQLGAITPLYASPESFLGQISIFSDQYSLGIVYHELLTGKMPFSGKNFRQLAMQHAQSPPDLTALPESDRELVARVLAKNPRDRFPNCMEFVHALYHQRQETSPLPESGRGTASIQPARTQEIIFKARKHTPSCVPPPTIGRDQVPPSRALSPNEKTGHPFTLEEHQFLECLGSSPLGEMWRTQTPDGTSWLVKLVNTFLPEQAGEFQEVLARFRQLTHPGLVPTAYLPRDPTRLALISPDLPETLATRFQQCRTQNLSGIPRLELLDLLTEVAQTLDEIGHAAEVYHLGLSPYSVLMGSGRTLVADHGLVQWLWLPAKRDLTQISGLYASPELLKGQLTPSADQYSLALLFYELLTGIHPLAKQTRRQMDLRRASGSFGLDLVSTTDQFILLKALAANPERRFPCCRDLMESLRAGAVILSSRATPEESASTGNTPRADSAVIATGETLRADALENASVTTPAEAEPQETMRKVITSVVDQAKGTLDLRTFRGIRYLLTPGQAVEHSCYARIVPGTTLLKLAGFRDEWGIETVEESPDHFHYRVDLTRGRFLGRLLGNQPVLEISGDMVPPPNRHTVMTRVDLRINVSGCPEKQRTQMLKKTAPVMIESLRTTLHAGPERREHPRWSFPGPLTLAPLDGSAPDNPWIAEGKDISLGGLGFYLPMEPTTAYLTVQLQSTDEVDPLAIPVHIVRVHPCQDGRWDVGVRFLV